MLHFCFMHSPTPDPVGQTWYSAKIIEVNDRAFCGCDWVFSDVDTVCRQSEQNSQSPVNQFSFPYEKC